MGPDDSHPARAIFQQEQGGIIVQIGEVESALGDLEKRVRRLQQDENKYQHELSNARVRRKRLESECASASNTTKESLKSQIREAVQVIEELQQRLARVRSDLTEAELEKRDLERQLSNLQEDLLESDGAAHRMRDWANFEKERAERTISERDEARNEVVLLERRFNDAEKNGRQLQRGIESIRGDMDRLARRLRMTVALLVLAVVALAVLILSR